MIKKRDEIFLWVIRPIKDLRTHWNKETTHNNITIFLDIITKWKNFLKKKFILLLSIYSKLQLVRVEGLS